jgi:hypothetical protein
MPPRLLHEFFALPISLGSVVALQQQGSAALAPVSDAIHLAVQQQDRCNIDETSSKRPPMGCSLRGRGALMRPKACVRSCWHMRMRSGHLCMKRESNRPGTLWINAAEQALRGAVLWRKGCFGAYSADGNRVVARILTVSVTCRKQQRHLLTFVTEAIAAHWAGCPAPILLSTPIAGPSVKGYPASFRREHNGLNR